MSTLDRALRVPGIATVSIGSSDAHSRRVLVVAVIGIVSATTLGVVGLPDVGMHLFTHELGLMSPTCGATRAVTAAGVGDLGRSWMFNPLGTVLVIGAWGYVARELVGRTLGRWLNLSVQLSGAGSAVVFVTWALLWIRQQAHAELLL